MKNSQRIVIACCVAMIAALLVVGAVSHGVLRHIVQTSPLWIAIVLASRKSNLAKWAAVPSFVFWLFLMGLIWLFLLGWARVITGTFSPVEIAMTVVVGTASVVGTVTACLDRSASARVWAGIAMALLVALLHVAALRVSLLPQIAHR
jgi:FtsH-binding integral membrane protein